jgi:5-methylthioadenosine/S-adenosylhomocysteine deaminase
MTPESADLPESVDLMIEARWVLPVAPVNTVLVDHAVAVRSGRIVALGPISQMNARFEARERIARRDHALLPGFVNAHTRAATTLLRGLPVAGPRAKWLRDTVGPIERRCMSADFVREGTQLAIAEMLRAGITSFADMYWFPEEAARAASAARIRVAIGLPVTDAPNQWAENANAHFEKAEQLWDEYKADPWVCLYFAPHDPACLSEGTWIRVRRIADELDARVAVEEAPLRKLNELGLLRPGFTAIGNVSDADFELVAATGVCVVACMQSDLRLGGRVMPLSSLEAQQVTIGLGTGAPASVGALDMLAESRAAALHGVRAQDALRLATLGGATALGIGAITGSLEPGKSADLVCLDLNRLGCQPALGIADTLVFGAVREQVSDVWTSGRAVVSGGQLLAFDELEMARLRRKWSFRLEGDAA